jgi:hypothetical protein
MKKAAIDTLMMSANIIEGNCKELKRHLQYLKECKPKEYKASERHEAEESIAHCENELVWSLIEIHKEVFAILLKIDPEAAKEMKDFYK